MLIGDNYGGSTYFSSYYLTAFYSNKKGRFKRLISYFCITKRTSYVKIVTPIEIQWVAVALLVSSK